MATAECVLALSSVRPLLTATQQGRAELAIASGREWLYAHQDQYQGGWGVEPTSGTSGTEPRLLSTFLALRALHAAGDSLSTSQSARKGMDFIWSLYDGSGGFSGLRGRASDACSTARASWAVLQLGAEHERRNFRANALRFVHGRRPKGALWPLDTETYVPDGSPGQIIFNSNTTAELLTFFVMMRDDTQAASELVEWFIDNQRNDGSWPLGSNQHSHEDVVTWSTNEAVIALSNYLSMAGPTIGQPPTRVPFGKPRSWLAAWILGAIAVIEGVFLLGMKAGLEESWATLPADYRTTFTWSIVVAFAVNLASTFVAFLVGRNFNKRGPDGTQ